MNLSLRKYILQFFGAFFVLMIVVFLASLSFGFAPPAATSFIALIACCAGTAQNFIKSEGRGITKPERIKFSTISSAIYTGISFILLMLMFYFVFAGMTQKELVNATGLERLPTALEWVISIPFALAFAFGLTWATIYLTISFFGRKVE